MNENTSVGTDEWTIRVQDVFSRCGDMLMRRIAQRLLKPRNQWPLEELVERSVATLTNAAIVDRRIAELSPAAQKALALIGLSQQPVWNVGQLIALLALLDHVEGLQPVLDLLESGLAQPELPAAIPTLNEFETWLGPEGIASARLFVHPAVTARAMAVDFGFPTFTTRTIDVKAIRQSDGLEWLLRTAVAWQHVANEPLRLTQQQTLFKRDQQRFQTDIVLGAPFADQLVELPDVGLLSLQLALAAGLIESEGGILRGKPAPDLWEQNLLGVLLELGRKLLTVNFWNPLTGWQSEGEDVFSSIAFASLLILRDQKPGEWIQASSIAEHLYERHPSWSAILKKKKESATVWLERFFLGIGYPLRLIEFVEEPSGTWFRLGDVGRHGWRGDKAPVLVAEFRQTLIMQPNGEIILFRQGLTPELIGKLSRFAIWRNLGSACTMELTAESVYHGLETGLSSADIQRLLEQHGTHALPATVLDSLQRWASKRERIAVWPAATLLEFSSESDLETAFQRGLITIKLSERIGIAAGGEEIDYRHFRLVGNRDYESAPRKCLTFDRDGLTFTVDAAQSDLILEAELGRLSEPVPGSPPGARRYVFTPVSLKKAGEFGISLSLLEQWALDRSGEVLSAAARLLFHGSGGAPFNYRMRLVVEVPSDIIADGLVQWPAAADLIDERLGPRDLVIEESNLEAFRELLKTIGVEMNSGVRVSE